MRPVLSFFSVLAFGAVSAAALIALMPWLTGFAPESLKGITGALEFNSVMIGLVLGLSLGLLGRYNWADIPRRAVTWFLVRERQFFYYVLIAICAVVLFYY
ncbi:hypothetical protein DLM45_03255 [Hyphomicrobium methylovorum]|uniref:hypothetical protein n=1 Tax=Hyphomicrobium methylovorum TaxID=84 RepID=UPI0015E68105|nr:hypothetical protein [Hyphomicrobium methylovorum]MBA2125241.1 hypothetical protein [Hyphomicrobium methylovorum]